MKKIILSLAFLAASSALTISAQGLCETAMKVADAAASSFESMKGKYSSTDYTGQWASTTALPGAKSSVIDENTGMFIATMGTGLSREQATAMVNKLANQMGCVAAWNNWKYDNSGEMFFQVFFSEKSQNLNADGGNYGGWAEGKPGFNNQNRDYSSYDRVAVGKTICIETRRIDGNGKFEVRILIYEAK